MGWNQGEIFSRSNSAGSMERTIKFMKRCGKLCRQEKRKSRARAHAWAALSAGPRGSKRRAAERRIRLTDFRLSGSFALMPLLDKMPLDNIIEFLFLLINGMRKETTAHLVSWKLLLPTFRPFVLASLQMHTPTLISRCLPRCHNLISWSMLMQKVWYLGRSVLKLPICQSLKKIDKSHNHLVALHTSLISDWHFHKI